MWLLPGISALSNLACRIFYRFRLEGPSPPPRGPLILVANHQNSLFDPAFVASAAGRPVRFLAKSTLFNDRRVGWLVRASGAIPVYRTHEVQDAAGKNATMFQSVFKHLESGHAIGIFPEGTSHSRPSMVQLKTGAARMALGLFARSRSIVPLVPVGLFLRDKGIFRSSALALRGEPVEWGDLAARGAEDREAVSELTERLETALREVTLNLERWEDRPLVETIEAIWTATRDPFSDPVERVRRSQAVATALSVVRRKEGEDWQELADRVIRHEKRLSRMGLRPTDLAVKTDLSTSIHWAARRIHLLLPFAIGYAVLASGLFLPPFLLTDLLIRIIGPEEDQRSTYKALIAAPLYTIWLLALWGFSWWSWGPWLGLSVLILAPIVGSTGLTVRERLKDSWRDLRQFIRLKSRRHWVERLRANQAELASELAKAYRQISGQDRG